MTSQLAIVLCLLVAAIVMFAMNKPRMDMVALIMLTALPFTDVLTMNEALAGFSDPNIVLIAALFVIGEGLVRTGVARQLGDWLSSRAGSDETKLVSLLMLVVCGLGATMSSTAVTAIFIPVTLRISQTAKVAPSRLMMPISVAALISGMTTLIATAPNLVVNSELVRHGQTGFRFFSFTPFGLPILGLGVAYMIFARRWLPASDQSAQGYRSTKPKLTDWLEEYQLTGHEHRVRVLEGSTLVGRTLVDIGLRDTSGATVVAIDRQGRLVQPHADSVLEIGDILFVDLFASESDIAPILEKYSLESLPLSGAYFTDLSQDLGMAEAIVPDLSDLIGKSIVESDFRKRFRLTAVGLRRGSSTLQGGIRNERLKVGDTLLLIGPWEAIRHVAEDANDLVVYKLPVELEEVLPVRGKALQAVFCLAVAVGLMISGIVPNVQAAVLGCLLMGVFGCIDLNSAYRSIDWKTIVLIVGMLPFSIALERTGGVEMAADGLMSVIGGAGPRAVLATLFIVTATLGMFISNTATAVLMAPIAISVADELGASPYPFAMIIALAASTAFMTPVSSPVNTLVVTPGNYSFGDFIRVGVPLSMLVLIVSVIMVPMLLPL